MNRAARVILSVAAVLLVVWLLFTVVFPWVDEQFLIDPTLSSMAPGYATPATG